MSIISLVRKKESPLDSAKSPVFPKLYVQEGRPSYFYNPKLLVFGGSVTRMRWWNF